MVGAQLSALLVHVIPALHLVARASSPGLRPARKLAVVLPHWSPDDDCTYVLLCVQKVADAEV